MRKLGQVAQERLDALQRADTELAHIHDQATRLREEIAVLHREKLFGFLKRKY